MQLPVDAEKITGSSELVTVWDSAALRRQRGNPHLPTLSRVIDELGRGSKVAQGLNHVLTSVERLTENPGHRLYLLMRDRSAIGIIKVGVKKLFIRTKSSDLKEIDPLCVLDFYVCESEQRSGYGRLLYDTMLAKEGVAPHQLGYDRPSPKFLSFLRKHFGLSDYIPQTNNFVVFEAYFGGPAPRPTPATQVAFRPDARASAATESAPPQARGRVAPMPHSYVPQDALPSQTAPPAPIPLNTTPTNRLPALKATDGRPPQQQQQGVPSKQAAEQPTAMSQGRPNGLLQASLPSRQASSQHATATIPASVALAATLPSKSASQAAAAQRRDLSPSTRSSMAYNIITLEGAEALSKSCTPVRQTTGGYRR